MKRSATLSLFLTATACLVTWETLHHGDFFYGRWPSLADVVAAALDRAFALELASAAWRTIATVSIALLVGILAGAVVGTMVGLAGERLHGVYVLLNGFRSVPVSVLVPVFLTVFGLRGFVVPLVAVPVFAIMAANVAGAVRESARNRAQLLALFEFRRAAYVRHVLPWDLADSLVATLRIVIPLALAMEIALDYFLALNLGVGALVALYYQSPSGEARMLAGIILAAALGILTVSFVDRHGKRLLKWKQGT